MNKIKTRIITIACICIPVTGISGCSDKPAEQYHPVELTDLLVSPASVSLLYGGEPSLQQLTATVLPENVTDVIFTWLSGNRDVATVSPTGLVTAEGVGSTQIAVTANEQKRKYIPVNVRAIDISVSPTFISLVYGGTPGSQQLTAIVLPENAADKNVITYKSGNDAVATVSPTGLVTAAGAGSTLITVMVKKVSKYVQVVVSSDESKYADGFVTNGVIKLGVDMNAGGSVYCFSEVYPERNLLNHADKGRFIQQSYYGAADGSVWDGTPWTWNPVQGGGYMGQAAKVLESDFNSETLYIKSLPKHWATGQDITEVVMEEWITLKGKFAQIHYRMAYSGSVSHPASHQELPAVFVDAALQNLVYYKGNAPWTNGAPAYHVPGWPNEYDKRTEHWSAYVNDAGWGIGVYTPGTADMTMYRYGDGTLAGPTGSHCSYFSPVRTMSITPGLVFEYDVYLTIGTVNEIRSVFYDIRNYTVNKKK